MWGIAQILFGKIKLIEWLIEINEKVINTQYSKSQIIKVTTFPSLIFSSKVVSKSQLDFSGDFLIKESKG